MSRMPFVHAVTVVLAAILLVGVSSCGGGNEGKRTPTVDPTTSAFQPLSIRRTDGRQLSIETPPKRIISLSPGATEIIFSLGAEEALVAVDKYSNYPGAAERFPEKIDGYEPNIEGIAALQPDLVIVAADNSGIVAALDRLGIPVLFEDLDTDVRTIGAVFDQVVLLGKITDQASNAASLMAALQARVRRVEDKVATVTGDGAPRVYHEIDSTFYTVSNGSFVGDLYNTLRASNIADDGAGVQYPQMTQEAIIAANPQVIVLADEAAGVTADSVKARPGWSSMDAVKDGRVFVINPDIASRPGPRIVDALEMLAKVIYPDRFP